MPQHGGSTADNLLEKLALLHAQHAMNISGTFKGESDWRPMSADCNTSRLDYVRAFSHLMSAWPATCDGVLFFDQIEVLGNSYIT